MYVVFLARGPLRSHFKEVAFVVHGLSVFIGLAAAEQDWIATLSLARDENPDDDRHVEHCLP